jgi:hypothetical protein
MGHYWVVVLASGEHIHPGYAGLSQAGQVPIKTSCFYFIILMMPVQIRHQIVALSTQPLCRISPDPWQLQDPSEMCSPLKIVIILYVERFDFTFAFKSSVTIELGRFP